MKDRHTKHAEGHKSPHDGDGGSPAPAAQEIPVTPPAPELAAAKDQLLRLQADFDNFRKRTLREREEWSLRACEDLLTRLLPVLDHFNLGLRSAADHAAEQTIIDGFQMVYDQLFKALQDVGLQPIDAEGTVFDPHRHEAVTHVPSNDVPADTVITQTRRGYMLGDLLLRAAQVIVSSGPADTTQDPGAGDSGSTG